MTLTELQVELNYHTDNPLMREVGRHIEALLDERAEIERVTLMTFEKLEAERDTLKTRLAEVEKDAARYRWLRNLAKEGRLEATVAMRQWDYLAQDTSFDAVIDEAMKEQP